MANFSPIHRIVNAALDLDLANPNLQISEKESLLRERAIMLGCLDYFRVCPVRGTYVTTYSTTGDANGTFTWTGITPPRVENGVTYIPFDELITGCTPGVKSKDLEHAYFLGILHMERPYFGNYSNPSLWSINLMGINMADPAVFKTDPMEMIVRNTYDDLSTGQPEFVVDTANARVIINPPFGIGQLSMQVAIGYDTPEYVEPSKVDFLCKFISYRFIEAIIQARDGVKFDADFEISTEALQRRLEKLKEETDSIKNHSIFVSAQWS